MPTYPVHILPLLPHYDVSVLQRVVRCLGKCLGCTKHYIVPVSNTLFSKSHLREEGWYEHGKLFGRKLGGPLRSSEMSN